MKKKHYNIRLAEREQTVFGLKSVGKTQNRAQRRST